MVCWDARSAALSDTNDFVPDLGVIEDPDGCIPDPDGALTYCGEDDVPLPESAARGALPQTRHGLGDQLPLGETSLFTNPDFQRLGLNKVRRIVPFNVAQLTTTLRFQETREWLDAAVAAGYEPIVSFEKCQTPTGGIVDCAKNAPTEANYEAAVQAFLTLFPNVRYFTAWNEPNNASQPFRAINTTSAASTSSNSAAFRAGRRWNILSRLCKSGRCFAGAGDFSDLEMANVSNAKSIGRDYLSQYRKGMGYARPTFWAWHAYGDARDRINPQTPLRWKALNAFLRYTQRGETWITEVGPVFRAGDVSRNLEPGNAAELIRLLLREAPLQVPPPQTSRRVTRIYAYQWISKADATGSPAPKFDSGLLDWATGAKRGAYFAFCAEVTGSSC